MAQKVLTWPSSQGIVEEGGGGGGGELPLDTRYTCAPLENR